MITNDNKHSDGVKNWHYLTVKNLSRLLRGITLNYNGDFYCLNCLHSYRTENKLKRHEKVCKTYDYCYVEMSKENKKIPEYNSGEKSLKAPFTIYADLECILSKIHTCQNGLKKSYTEKKAEHIPSGYSCITCCSFDISKNEWNQYREVWKKFVKIWEINQGK